MNWDVSSATKVVSPMAVLDFCIQLLYVAALSVCSAKQCTVLDPQLHDRSHFLAVKDQANNYPTSVYTVFLCSPLKQLGWLMSEAG